MSSKDIKIFLSIVLLLCLFLYLVLDYVVYSRQFKVDVTTPGNIVWAGPQPGEDIIMFAETSCALRQKEHRLSPRQACAIESVAREHLSHQVYVFHTCVTDWNRDLGFHPDAYMRRFHRLPNVFFIRLDVAQLVEEWWPKNNDTNSLFRLRKGSGVEELARLLLLWKYGGIYMGFDFVVVRSLSALSNFVVSDGERILASPLGFTATGSGHQQVEELLQEINSTHSGPKSYDQERNLLTRVMLKSCKVSRISEMTAERCNGIRILPTVSFYPKHSDGSAIEMFVEDYATHAITRSLKSDSRIHAVHVGNQNSSKQKVTVGSVYGLLAAEFCPLVYSNCGNKF